VPKADRLIPCKYGDPTCPCQDGGMCNYEGQNPMPVPSRHAYRTHRWVSHRQMTDYGTGYEYVCFCDECGTENMGDPDEFPELKYITCMRVILGEELRK